VRILNNFAVYNAKSGNMVKRIVTLEVRVDEYIPLMTHVTKDTGKMCPECESSHCNCKQRRYL
jgi:hypothetical protein